LVEQLANDQDLPVPQIDEPALKLLQEHTWPGNIRELRNALECALALGSGGTIHVSDLPEHLTMRRGLADEASAPPNVPLQAVVTLAQARKQGEYRRLVDVLQRCENNRSQAAKVLGISRTALYKKLVTFGI
jgi:DNA-binding NtrC family response regulator